MNVKTISLASFTLTLHNPNRGDQISIGGGGKLIGSCQYSYQQNAFNMTATADGGVVASHNASKYATVTISFTQTSPDIDTLNNYILWCHANPDAAGDATIEAKDSSGVFAFSAEGCLPEKIPDNSLGETAQERSFVFMCAKLVPNEQIGGNR